MDLQDCSTVSYPSRLCNNLQYKANQKYLIFKQNTLLQRKMHAQNIYKLKTRWPVPVCHRQHTKNHFQRPHPTKLNGR